MTKIQENRKLFPAQEKTEQILAVLRKHWFTYAIFWFVGILMLAIFGVAIGLVLVNISVISQNLINVLVLLGATYLLFIAGLMIFGFVDFYLDVYVITDKRIVSITQDGFFKRAISELDVHQIQDVNADVEGFFPTLLHYGNVRIQTAAELPNFIFESIPHPYETSKKIIDLHQAHKRYDLGNKEPSRAKLIQAWHEEIPNAGEAVTTPSQHREHKLLLKGMDKAMKQEAEASGELHEGEKISLPTSKSGGKK